jgi:hypothetical protein
MPLENHPRAKFVGLTLVWAVIALAFFSFSYRLMALPDRTFATRSCALFHTDVREAVLTMRTSAPTSVKHPLARELWWPTGYVTRNALEPLMPAETAKSIAACLAMALFASFGVLACALASSAFGAAPSRVLAVLPISALSTANVITLIPEYYGISYFLLSGTFLAAVALRGRTRTVLLIVLTGLLAATTITNMIFGVLCLLMPERGAEWGRPALFAMRAIVVALVMTSTVLLAGAFGGFTSRFQEIDRNPASQDRLTDSVLRSLRLGRIATPDRLLTYSGLAWVYPVVAPTPHIASVHPFPTIVQRPTSSSSDGRLDLSYDPWTPQDYGIVNGVSAIAWGAFLIWSTMALFRAGGEARTALGVLSIWICGNILVHLVWGDEMFMYSPHWSWAVAAIPLLAAKWVPVPALLGISVIVGTGQVVTLRQVLELSTQIAALCP